MTDDELKSLLKSIGIPVAYSHFTKPPKLPYLVYLRVNDYNMHADNKVYFKLNNYQIELYTEKKDLALEEKVEAMFDLKEIPYSTSEEWIQDENMFQVVYSIQI